jgi:hypothetical protein
MEINQVGCVVDRILTAWIRGSVFPQVFAAKYLLTDDFFGLTRDNHLIIVDLIKPATPILGSANWRVPLFLG